MKRTIFLLMILVLICVNSFAFECKETTVTFNLQNQSVNESTRTHTFFVFKTRQEAEAFATEKGVPENILKEQGIEEYKVFLTMPVNGCILLSE